MILITEHKCVLESSRGLKESGFEVIVLPVDRAGLLDPRAVADAVTEETALVSVTMVNNEIGVIQPIAETAEICAARGVLFHTDSAPHRRRFETV